jgi:hypothetical protein
MRKWVRRFCIGLGVVITGACLLVFLLMTFPLAFGLHPLSFFERRDPTTCPGYYDRLDEKLLVCIYAAREASRRWILTLAEVQAALGIAKTWLAPSCVLFVVWLSYRLARRAWRSGRRWFTNRPDGQCQVSRSRQRQSE